MLAVLALALCLTTSSQTAEASDSSGPSDGERVFDAMLLRPLGAIGTAVGLALFVCSLPLTAPTLQSDTAWDVFVLRPAGYTFQRALGDL